MLTRDFAEHFAEEWIAAWNAHDLQCILSHYADDFSMHSPIISELAGEPSGVLRGKAAIGDYWQKALARRPDLHFELLAVFCGADSIVLHYRRNGGAQAAEVFFFNAEGLVREAAANY